MPLPTKHNELIQDIIRTTPGTATYGFRKAVIAAIERQQPDEWYTFILEEYKEDLTFVPDAYSIDEPGRSITIYEVEVGHRLNKHKFSRLLDTWICLDGIEWELKLIVVNQFGSRSEVDMCTEWHKSCQPAKPPLPKAPKPPKPVARKPRGNKQFWWENAP